MEQSEVPEKVVEAVTGAVPSGFRYEIMQFFDSDLGRMTQTLLSLILVILMTVVIKRIVSRGLHRLQTRLRAQNNSSAALIGFMSHIVVGLVYIFGIISVIGVLRTTIPVIDKIFTSLLAAGGIITVIAGIASQEALGSMVSGIMILAFKPFELGDVVRYVDNDISGVIEEITVHHTTIRTWENKRVIIPNSKMNSAIIENADYADSKVCVLLDIGVTYESDLVRAKALLMQEIEKHPDYIDNRTPMDKENGVPRVLVRIKELADSAVVLRAWVWARDNATAAAMKSDLLQSVKAAYEANGVEIAYPHLVVVNK